MLTEIDENDPRLTDTTKAARLDFRYDRPLAFIGSMEFGIRADRRVKANDPDGNSYTFGGLTTNPALNDTYLVGQDQSAGGRCRLLGGPNAVTFPLFDLNKLRAFENDPRAVLQPADHK